MRNKNDARPSPSKSPVGDFDKRNAHVRSAAEAGRSGVAAQADARFQRTAILRARAVQAHRPMHAPESALLLGTFRPDAAPRLPGDAAQAQGDASARRIRAG